MGWLAVAIALIGFSRRYLLPMSTGTFEAPAIVHFHGIVTFTWIVFFVAQSWIAMAGRISVHRRLGLAGVALGTLLVFTATEITILLLARGLREGAPAPREFAATLFSIELMVALLFGAAIAQVERPEAHKRLMLLAMLVILTPALARIIQLGDGDMSRLMRNDLAGLASDLLILIPMAYDWRTRGRPHRVYLVAGGGIVAIQLLTLALRGTQAWYAAADRIADMVG
jgi:hypothetical protein